MHYFVIENDTNRIVGTSETKDMSEFPEFMKNEYHKISTKEFFKGCKTDEEKIDKMFSTAKIYYDRGFTSNNKQYIINIIWGDWKHGHRFCHDLMNVVGYTKVNTIVLEEDGSDAYSAEHTYMKIA